MPLYPIAGGNDTEVQFNDAGVFAGDPNLIWDKVEGQFLAGPQTGLQTLSDLSRSYGTHVFTNLNTITAEQDTNNVITALSAICESNRAAGDTFVGFESIVNNTADNASAIAIHANAFSTGAFASSLTGLLLDISAANGTTCTTEYGIHIQIDDTTATVSSAIGLAIENVTAGATNYAITTGAGLISFGDSVKITTRTGTPSKQAAFTSGGTLCEHALAWPIGAVFIAVVSTNPNTLLGYGTWSAIASGRVLVGLDSGDTDFDVVEETGGSKTHTLVTNEIPSHNHTQDSHNHTQDSHNHTQNSHSHVLTELRDATTGSASTNIALSNDASSTLGTKTTASTTATNQATTATNQATTATNQATGGAGAHNNVQPYFVVYMWKRTA